MWHPRGTLRPPAVRELREGGAVLVLRQLAFLLKGLVLLKAVSGASVYVRSHIGCFVAVCSPRAERLVG